MLFFNLNKWILVNPKIYNLELMSKMHFLNRIIIILLFLCLSKVKVLHFIIRNKIKKYQFIKSKNISHKFSIHFKEKNDVYFSLIF